MAILVVNGLTKRFGGLVAVDHLDFQVEAGIISGIIGPNGSGKTTFFDLITGFHTPDAGNLMFNGISLMNRRPYEITQLGVARTFQDPQVFASMTALENVLIGQHCYLRSSMLGAVLGSVRTWEEMKAQSMAARLLKFVGLEGMEDVMAGNLPHGGKRLLEIARALATRPELLLLDEPTAGLDSREAKMLVAVICHLREKLKLTILLIEHRMPVVMSMCDQVTVLDHGAKIAEGKPAQVQRDPKVIEAYLGHGSETMHSTG